MAQVYIISGDKMSGKTTRCREFAMALKDRGFLIGGFIAPGEIEEGRRGKIFLQNLKSGENILFADREARDGWQHIQSFYFDPKAVKTGEIWLQAHQSQSDYLFIDEVGRFDIQGEIWGNILPKLINSSNKLVLSIRDVFVDEVVSHFKMDSYKIVSSLEDFF